MIGAVLTQEKTGQRISFYLASNPYEPDRVRNALLQKGYPLEKINEKLQTSSLISEVVEGIKSKAKSFGKDVKKALETLRLKSK